MDPPEHSRYRGTILPGLKRRQGDGPCKRASAIRDGARKILEDFAAAARSAGPDGIDFVKHVAVELPVQMLAELFQVPASRHDDLFRWSNAIVAHLRWRPRASDETIGRWAQCWAEMSAYAMKLTIGDEERNLRPGDDLRLNDGSRAQYWTRGVDEGANGIDGGPPMSIQRYLAAFGLLIVAGNETTRNSISGGLLALAPGMLCSIPSTSPIGQGSGPVPGTRSSPSIPTSSDAWPSIRS